MIMTYQELVQLSEMYNIDLFENIHLYDKIDKELLKYEILHLGGYNQVLHTHPFKMKEEIFYFFLTNFDSIKKMTDALLEEYNPIHNFDRYEEYDELFEKDNSTDSDNTINNNVNSTVNNDVSAFDSSSYSPQSKETNTSNENSSSRENKRENETNKHTSKNRLYGNIGVTTSQQMLEAEMKLREKYNIYQVIARMFCKELLLRI